MTVFCAALLAACSGLSFPERPLPDEFVRGAELANKKPELGAAALVGKHPRRHSVDVVWQEDRVWVGTWTNGHSPQKVEYAVWLSPALVSRWLGFLSARERWPAGEAETRWAELRSDLDGRITIAVQLSAFPRFPILELSDGSKANRSEVEDVRFVLDTASGPHSPSVEEIALWRARSKASLDDFKWWLQTPATAPLVGEFEEQAERPLPLGDFHRRWLLITAPTGVAPDGSFTLRILSEPKERVASFNQVRQDPACSCG